MTRPAFCIPIHINLRASFGDGGGLANTGKIIGDFFCYWRAIPRKIIEQGGRDRK